MNKQRIQEIAKELGELEMSAQRHGEQQIAARLRNAFEELNAMLGSNGWQRETGILHGCDM